MIEGHFGLEKDFGKERLDNDVELEFDAEKFLGRMGAIEMRLITDEDRKSVISTQGNRTNFEIVIRAFEFPQALVMKGEFVGEKALFEKYGELLTEFGKDILEREIAKATDTSKKSKTKSRPQKKVPMKTLENIWKRDHYSCVYCGKHLLHPNTVKSLLDKCNNPNELNAHVATHDHHLPASKFPVVNDDERNLYACCKECNFKKSDSLSTKTWTPAPRNSWAEVSKEKPIIIAGLEITAPE